MSAVPLLEFQSVTKRFGGLTAVDGLDLRVAEGSITAIIGPNGAGKTTAFNLTTGVHQLDAGEIRIGGVAAGRLPAHRIAHMGVSRTFQNVQLFGNMSVVENVMVGAHGRGRAGFLGAALRLSRMRTEEMCFLAKAQECLAVVGLESVALEQDAASLPFGQQRLLEIARALAAEPRLLLLDEPAAGLTSVETARLADLIRAIRQTGITVLLVDHDMDLVMQVSDEVIALDHGTKIAEGTPRAIQRNPQVIAAYLGEDA